MNADLREAISPRRHGGTEKAYICFCFTSRAKREGVLLARNNVEAIGFPHSVRDVNNKLHSQGLQVWLLPHFFRLLRHHPLPAVVIEEQFLIAERFTYPRD